MPALQSQSERPSLVDHLLLLLAGRGMTVRDEMRRVAGSPRCAGPGHGQLELRVGRGHSIHSVDRFESPWRRDGWMDGWLRTTALQLCLCAGKKKQVGPASGWNQPRDDEERDSKRGEARRFDSIQRLTPLTAATRRRSNRVRQPTASTHTHGQGHRVTSHACQ